MGGSTTQPQQTTTTQISPQAQQLFNLAYPGIASYAANPPPSYYPGSTVAPFTPTQTAGQESLVSGAGAQQRTAGQAADLYSSIPGMLQWGGAGITKPYVAPNIPLSTLPTSSDIFNDPGIWNPAANTGLRSAIEAAQRPTMEALTEQALPNIRYSAISQGPFGGSREGIAEGIATRGATRQMADTAAQMANAMYGANLGAVNQRYATNLNEALQNYGINTNTLLALGQQGLTARGQDINAATSQYGTNIGALNQLLGLTPTVQAAQTAPGATLSGVGQTQQTQQQAMLNDAIAAYYYGQLAPYMKAQDILGLIPSIPGASTTSTANTPQVNPTMQALGGAASGAAIGSLAGPFGGAAGAGVGALLPFLLH